MDVAAGVREEHEIAWQQMLAADVPPDLGLIGGDARQVDALATVDPLFT